MKVKLEYKYKIYPNRLGASYYHIILVHVEDGVEGRAGQSGYNCWGYERQAEAAVGDGVVFKPKWATAGNAVDAALEEYEKKHSPLVVKK